MNRKTIFTIRDYKFDSIDIYDITSTVYNVMGARSDFIVSMVKYIFERKIDMAVTLYPIPQKVDVPSFGLGFSFHIDKNMMCVDDFWIYDKELFNEATSCLVWDSIEHKMKYKTN